METRRAMVRKTIRPVTYEELKPPVLGMAARRQPLLSYQELFW